MERRLTSGGKLLSDYFIYDLKFYDENLGCLASSEGIYLTFNKGETWNKISPEIAVRLNFEDEEAICFLSSEGKGMFCTPDLGKTFTSYQLPVTKGSFWDFQINGKNGWIITNKGEILSTNNEGVDWTYTNILDIIPYK